MKKIIIILLSSIVIFFIFLLNLKKTTYYENVFKVTDFIFPTIISSTLKMIANNDINSKRINNDYNKLFLPKTQYAKVDFAKIELDFIKPYENRYVGAFKLKTFYLDFYKDYVFVMPKNGTFYYSLIDNLLKGNKNFQLIKSNIEVNNVLDLFIDEEKIYVSYVKKEKDCKHLYLAKSEINLKELNFENIFSITNDCRGIIQGGRIQKIIQEKDSYILLSTSADSLQGLGQKDKKPQSNKSLYGKIISINEKDNSYNIFTKGHRNIIGLSAIQNTIIATENGPYGGDEINLIIKNKNYGWDIASYGKKYGYFNDNQGRYKEHEELGFESPLFSFIPSLGISEIIKIDNNFDDDWRDNFLIGTLNHRHILRVKINLKHKKIDYYEDIYIGERIRDLKYFKKKSLIIMALEESGSIGILKKIN
ncbi:PQQ-dependent sugar dehydrogenase [Candidatus Pelagibacter sp.]|nr:PQQ-dependent sugar dehydrogenase [Candidatus Pelagibacter sp.]